MLRYEIGLDLKNRKLGEHPQQSIEYLDCFLHFSSHIQENCTDLSLVDRDVLKKNEQNGLVHSQMRRKDLFGREIVEAKHIYLSRLYSCSMPHDCQLLA